MPYMNVRDEIRDKKIFNSAKQGAYMAREGGKSVYNHHKLQQ